MNQRKSSMQAIVGLIALMLVVSSAVFSQPKIEEGKNDPPVTDRVLDQGKYWPLTLEDRRFTITGFNLDRRYAMNGSGEFLDVAFYVNNKTSENVNLITFVLAYNESNGIDTATRKLIPNTHWRHRDYDREKRVVHYIRMAPRNVPEKSVWSYQDPDFFKTSVHLARQRNAIAGNRPIPDLMPPLWKYLEYIRFNPDVGLPFVLYGDTGPTDDKVVESNYVAPSETERDSKVFKNIDRHTYTLESERRRTTVRTFHYSKFRAGYKYFNSVAIVVMDSDRVVGWKDQKGRELKPGEEEIDPIVFKKVMHIQKPLKNY